MIKMDALKEMYKDLHFTNIQIYIQSGNVIFQNIQSKQTDLGQKISKELMRKFGFEIPVIVLDTFELKEIIEKNPFVSDETKIFPIFMSHFLSSKPELIDSSLFYQKRLLKKNCNYRKCCLSLLSEWVWANKIDKCFF